MGNLDTREGITSKPIIDSMIPFTEKMYDMTPEELQTYKSAYTEEYHSDTTKDRKREVVEIFYAEFQYYQVRKDYNWVLEQYKLTGDKTEVRREILLQRIRGSTDSPISPEDIEYLISHMVKSDKDLLINGKWRLRLYEHGQGSRYGIPLDLDENIPYLIGVDPAGGKGGGDNSAITVLNPYNLQIAAEFKNPYISGTDLARLLITLVNDYIPNAVLIVEKNSMGTYLIDDLAESSVQSNLYWNKKAQPLEAITELNPEDRMLRFAAAERQKYGTFVSPKVRDAMFELLFKHVNECKSILNTEYLVDDICKLVRTSTGRIEATKGEHDDSLFSYLHTIYIWYTGDNLHLFGIDIKEHPILGELENVEGTLVEKTDISYFSTKDITFEQIVVQDSIELENKIKELVAIDPTIHDEVYSNYHPEGILNDTVNLGTHFFDDINE